MSNQTVLKDTDIVACDYCDEEIVTNDTKEWAHVIREYVSQPTNKARHLVFKWPSRVTFSETRYDFHTECFDRMVKSMLEDKSKPAHPTTKPTKESQT